MKVRVLGSQHYGGTKLAACHPGWRMRRYPWFVVAAWRGSKCKNAAASNSRRSGCVLAGRGHSQKKSLHKQFFWIFRRVTEGLEDPGQRPTAQPAGPNRGPDGSEQREQARKGCSRRWRRRWQEAWTRQLLLPDRRSFTTILLNAPKLSEPDEMESVFRTLKFFPPTSASK